MASFVIGSAHQGKSIRKFCLAHGLNEVFSAEGGNRIHTIDKDQWILSLLGRVMLVFVGARLHLEITNTRRKVVHSTPRLFTVVVVKSTVRCSLGLWRLLGLNPYCCRAAALKPHAPPTFSNWCQFAFA